VEASATSLPPDCSGCFQLERLPGTGKRRLFTAHTYFGHWLSGRFSQKFCDEIIFGRLQRASLKLSIICLGVWKET
jgi:hypothetical protein